MADHGFFCYNLSMAYRRSQTYFFISLLVASVLLTLAMFGTYLRLLAFGGVLAVVCRPFYDWLVRRLRSAEAAAFLTVIAMGLVVVVPLGIFAASLYLEASSILSGVGNQLTNGLSQDILARFVPAQFAGQVADMLNDSQVVVKAVAGYLTTSLPGFFSNLMEAALGFFIILFSAYYLLKDGAAIKQMAVTLSPLANDDDEAVINKVLATIGAVVNGVLVMAFIKAVLAAISFALVGVPQPLFWGAMTGLASILPVVGTALITAPAVGYLLLTGHIIEAAILAVIAIVLIGAIDNFLQPKLVGDRARIHPLLILLSVFGGLSFYGFSGFVLGPLTLAVTLALLEIYKKEFRAAFERLDG